MDQVITVENKPVEHFPTEDYFDPLQPSILRKPKMQIPFIDTAQGLLNLGPSNPGALLRMANYTQAAIDQKLILPDSAFCEWAATRITGKDKQDLVIFIQGRRGSGKSYTALWTGYRLGLSIARRMGGKWQDYFSLKNVATLEDSARVMEIMELAGKYQVVIVDDCSLAISNRSWNSPQNKNFNALLSVARTKRWILIMTAPLKKHVDNQVREMCDITFDIYKSYHVGGFNIVKITSSDIGARGKEYNRKMVFDRKKISFWASFRPPQELVEEYDVQREAAACALNKRIVETGSFQPAQKKKEEPKTRNQKAKEKNFEQYGDKISKILLKEPDISVSELSGIVGLNWTATRNVIEELGLPVKKGKRGGHD